MWEAEAKIRGGCLSFNFLNLEVKLLRRVMSPLGQHGLMHALTKFVHATKPLTVVRLTAHRSVELQSLVIVRLFRTLSGNLDGLCDLAAYCGVLRRLRKSTPQLTFLHTLVAQPASSLMALQ